MGMCKWFLMMLPKLNFFCARKTSRNLKSEIIQILPSHSPPYGDVQVIFQSSTEIQNGHHGSTSIFLWAQKLKKISLVIFLKFQHHIPSNMGMCKWFYKDATKI